MENSTHRFISDKKLSVKEFFTDKVILVSFVLLALMLYGAIEMVYERYFILSATAFDAGLIPGSREVAEAMKEAVFGSGGEVKREAPWSLYIVNYMYMIYVGSGIIFIVAIAELFELESIKKVAAGFLTLGLAMVIGGLVTIFMDLNILNLHSMLLSPQFTSGMWLMLPLYIVYIPIVMFEIYLILDHKESLIKKIAVLILFLGLVIEFIEFYIQAKLFDMNSARHLWTTYPLLPLYFMISSFVASVAIMLFYTCLTGRDKTLLHVLEKVTLYFVIALGIYEAIAYLFIDKKWAEIILFGDFKYYFYLYILLSVAIPFIALFHKHSIKYVNLFAALSVIIGTYLGKLIFVYGGNAYPMSDRFGVGFEKYSEYELVKETIFFMPSWSEIAIVFGSFGVVLFIFRITDMTFEVSKKVNNLLTP